MNRPNLKILGALSLIIVILIIISAWLIRELGLSNLEISNTNQVTLEENSKRVEPIDKPNKVPLTFAPKITSNCRMKTAPQPRWFETKEGDCKNYKGYGPWIIATTVENNEFTGGSVADWNKINGWDYFFKDNPSNPGEFEISLKLDKINFDQPVTKDSYTAFGLNDWYLTEPVNLTEKIFLSFDIKVTEFNNLNDNVKNRISIGFVAEDKTGRRYYLEFNILKTSNFDLCTDINFGGDGVSLPCDTKGYIDRRSAGDLYKYDIVYYDLDAISRSETFGTMFLEASNFKIGEYFKVYIPYSKIFNSTEWAKTVNPSELTLIGTYILTEIYKEGISGFTIANYDLYKIY